MAKAKENAQAKSDVEDFARQLLTEAREMISAIHHQNDFTRGWVARCDALLNAPSEGDEA